MGWFKRAGDVFRDSGYFAIREFSRTMRMGAGGAQASEIEQRDSRTRDGRYTMTELVQLSKDGLWVKGEKILPMLRDVSLLAGGSEMVG